MLLRSLRRWKSSLLLALVTGLCLAQIPSLNLTPEVRRVGSKLRCLCGVCRNSMGDCPMLGCHSAVPGREKIAKLQAAGKGDQEIVDSFVKEQGLQVLVTPPAEGFSLLSWIGPPAVLLGGLGGIWFWMRRNKRPQTATAAETPAVDMERFRAQAGEELEKLDS